MKFYTYKQSLSKFVKGQSLNNENFIDEFDTPRKHSDKVLKEFLIIKLFYKSSP